ncbi:MAG: putative sulfate exporter family transporter [Saprospiraceae bacterium]|nr:putative sulfate exporter family transporter [Saprospiraceae bacterium]
MSVDNQFSRSEDFHAILLGVLILLAGLIIYFITGYREINEAQTQYIEDLETSAKVNPEFKSVEWYEAYDHLQAIQGSKNAVGTFLKNLTDKPGSWKSNPLASMQLSAGEADQISRSSSEAYQKTQEEIATLKEEARQAEQRAAEVGFSDGTKNGLAIKAIADWRNAMGKSAGIEKKFKTKSYSRWLFLLLLFGFLSLLFGFAHLRMGVKFVTFLKGFAFVFFIGTVSHWLAGQSTIKDLGIGYAAWAIVLGLLISNTVGVGDTIKSALSTELYIKTGLVILGAEILMSKVLAIGLPGIFVAWVVTPIVLITTYWFGQRVLKIGSKTLNMTISADMSVCGVSAAVATAAACKATKEELTLAVGLSMVFTSIMMVVLPMVINGLGMPEVLGGAWIGGTIDATGAVVAAGAFLGDAALNVAATIKMIQNILIGVIAFGVAIYFTRMGAGSGEKVGAGEIWRRFPKFVLGFIGASILFSIIYALLNSHMAYSLLDHGVIGGFTSRLRGWLFCLAFVSIGLSTNFKELKSHFTGGKPFILYICGQAFNLMLTLLMAYIMFYLVFPEITESI